MTQALPAPATASDADVVINEIMYNPPDPDTEEELEYVELYNRGDEDVDLSGWTVSDGITFTFLPGTTIEKNEYLVVCSDPWRMAEKYSIHNVAGPFEGRLDNQGERIVLSDDSGVPIVIDEVAYETGGEWPMEPDGDGPSLELVSAWADNSLGGNWRASTPPEDDGTPGAGNSCHEENPPPAVSGVARNVLAPTSSQTVTITAFAQDNTTVQAVFLDYATGPNPLGGTTTLEMSALGNDKYSATLPFQSNGTWVWYSIHAVDDAEGVGWWPRGAPEEKAWYRVENIPAMDGDIVINEIMYHNTVEMGEDFEWVEIFNASSRTIDLSLWSLRDDEDSHSFYFPMGTSLAAGDFLVISRDALRVMDVFGIFNVVGDYTFHLSDGGSQVRLFNANGKLVDLVEYGDSSPWPDLADGEGASLECVDPFADNSLYNNWGPGLDFGTPGTANSVYSPHNHDVDIVINEIMYHTADDNDEAQFIELFNSGSDHINLNGWEFTRGITHTFDGDTVIPPGGFLVLCKDPTVAEKTYGITGPTVAWDLGKLDHGGETLALVSGLGATIDIVKYDDASPWPMAADGHGSSLECINPFVDNNHPRNWRASSGATYWQFVQRTGRATSSWLFMYMLEAGECLIDDVSITDVGGTENYIPNGDFETSEFGWEKTGNHVSSYREIGQARSGKACLHVVATDTGGDSTNSVNVFTDPGLVKDGWYVLSFWVKHVSGGTRFYSRLSGGGLGGETLMAGSGLLSSPGGPNTAFSLDLPPFISSLEHVPSMPKPNEIGSIVAAVEDDVSVTLVTLEYKSALEGSWTSVSMHDDGINGDAVAGDGLYTALTRTYSSQTVVQYIVTAWDTAGNATRSPADNDPKPNHAYFVYDQEVVSKLPVYFLTVPNMSSINPYTDNYYPATFVYDGKVYENVGIRYRGQTSRSYPKKCLKIRFNQGDLFTGSFDDGLKSINLQAMWPDKSYLREALSYDLFRKMGLAYCETRHVLVHINGGYWGLFLEMESPGRRYLNRNGRDDSGNLYKAYNTGTSASGFEKKTNETTGGNADLADFLWGINNTPQSAITQYMNERTVVDSQIAYNAVNSVINNSDQPAKNYFLYHDPVSDKWEMFPWDMDLTYGRNFELSGGVCNDVIRWNNHIFFGTRIHPKNDGPWNTIVDRYFYPETGSATEPFRTQMYETTRYILETYFTPRLQYQQIDALAELIREEAARDRGKWGSYSGESTDLDSQVSIMKNYIVQRRAYLFSTFLTDRNSPRKPRNVYPREGDYSVLPDSPLQASAYLDPNSDAHTASQWQVRQDENDWTVLVIDTEEDTEHTTSYEVSPGTLDPLEVYCWRVRYKDATGLWSDWSDETSFALGVDTDLDGLVDTVESNTGTYLNSSDTGTDPRNPDTDNDGLMDGEEVRQYYTNPTLVDSDEDGLTDWEEIMLHFTNPNEEDSDNDRLPDGWEVVNLLDPKSSTGPDGASGDPDGDGLINIAEYLNQTNPTNVDSDGDGMDDSWEITQGFSPTDPEGENGPDGDPDEDGLGNLAEYGNATDPRNPDTDEDGLGDLWEVENGLDPKDENGDNGPDGDPDGDGMVNKEEMIAGTDPKLAESVFAVTTFQPDPGGVQIGWQTVRGKRYQVFVAGDLLGEWTPLGEEVVGNGGDATVVDETADSSRVRHYRVQVY